MTATTHQAVTAKGEHQLADRMIEAAEQAGVPLYPTWNWRWCCRRSPRRRDPDNLYKAIAEVIAFAYILAGKIPRRFHAAGQRGRTARGDPLVRRPCTGPLLMHCLSCLDQ